MSDENNNIKSSVQNRGTSRIVRITIMYVNVAILITNKEPK